jgi:hypothetical protein
MRKKRSSARDRNGVLYLFVIRWFKIKLRARMMAISLAQHLRFHEWLPANFLGRKTFTMPSRRYAMLLFNKANEIGSPP